MGGPGSTRWRDHTPKPLVEEALPLDLLRPPLSEALREPGGATGTLHWSSAPTGARLAEARFSVGPILEDGTRRLVLRFSQDPHDPKQVIVLQRVKVGIAHRWLAVCPDGCGRRARKLYALPRVQRFACWRCMGLQYRAAREHDRRIDNCRRAPRDFMAGRSRLHGLYSQFVTLRLFEEAERRGIKW